MKVLTFILVLIPWFLSGILFSSNVDYYLSIHKPSFAPSPSFFFPVWTILYILISISVTILFSNNYIKYEKEYQKSFICNYLFNQLYLFFFFTLKSPFLGFVDCVFILLTSLFLYYETKELNKKAAYFLIPYTLFNVYAVILSLSIYFMNL